MEKRIDPSPLVTDYTEQIDCLPRVQEIVTNEKTHRRYRLLVEIDRGGFGVVFEATDDKR
jgi:hypothetical protein